MMILTTFRQNGREIKKFIYRMLAQEMFTTIKVN